MKTYPIYLWPRGSLSSHLGSDTLFGAVCWGIHLLGLDLEALLERFNTEPQFAFSGLFPVLRGSERCVRFYPHPQLPPLGPDQFPGEIEDKIKKIKQAKLLKHKPYLSEELFTEVIQGKTDRAALLDRFRTRGFSKHDIEAVGQSLIRYDERRALQRRGKLDRIINEVDVQHNHVDRVSGATVEGLLFMEQETFFRAGSGLWCLLRTEKKTLQGSIAPALRYLADTGLGGNRSSGKGQFEIEVGDPFDDLPHADDPNCFVTLSRYVPQQGEWKANARPLHYQLLNLWPKRESKFARAAPGQSASPIYKRRLRMFAPGSIFPLQQPQQELYGRLVEAVPASEAGHTIWQSGITVPVWARIGGQR